MKKLLALVLALSLVGVFTACQSDKTENTDGKNDTTVTVAASSTPHAEILEVAKKTLQKDGYELVIKTMDDYVIPNTSTESGEVDANFFQHTPYLEQFNEENNTHLVSIAKIHYEPFGIYKGTSSSLKDIPDGAKIAVPNDATNEARALILLDANGLIKLKDNTNFTATKKDIAENPHNYDIVEVEAALVPKMLDDVAVGIINGNYALGANLNVNDALAKEDSASVAAQTYANVLVVKEGNENLEKIVALKKALLSDDVKNYINNTYNGAVLPIF